MSVKTSADVLIGGKVYTLSGYESEEYLQKVAGYINGKLSEFESMENVKRFSLELKHTLLELNIADDYYKAKEQAEKLEEDIREKDKEIYDLKHELISAQIREESRESAAGELEKENRELLLEKARLEAALADALAGEGKAVGGKEGGDTGGERGWGGEEKPHRGQEDGVSEWENWVEDQRKEAKGIYEAVKKEDGNGNQTING
ncbi:MAG: cell division protein ZapA [Lachnospiraceae bacterium]|nr:cell division protein ZapA [Lachnospiraceae bacterium]